MVRVIGIEVSKARLDVYNLGDGRGWQLGSRPELAPAQASWRGSQGIWLTSMPSSRSSLASAVVACP
jgi:hypothetical protein